MVIRNIVFVGFWALCLPANAGYLEYQNYQRNMKSCTEGVEAELLASPEFSGSIWQAGGRASVVCRHRLGETPNKFDYHEKKIAKKVNEIGKKRWGDENIIDVVSSLAKQYQSSFLGFGSSYGEEKQIDAIFELLVNSNMACSQYQGDSVDITDMLAERFEEEYLECELRMKRAITDYVRSYNRKSN